MAGEVWSSLTFGLQKNSRGCFAVAVQDFLRGLRTGEPFTTDRFDDLEGLRLMESCYVEVGMKR